MAGAYYGSAELSLDLSLVGRSVTPLWPPTGVALVALFGGGYRLWPAISLAAFAVNLPISPSALTAAGIAVGNTAAPLVAAFILIRARFNSELEQPKDALALVLAGTASTTLSATGGTLALVVSGAATTNHFGATWLVWWTGDAMGMLLVAPFLWSSWRVRRIPGWPRLAEAAGLSGLLVGAVVLAGSVSAPVLVVALPPLILIAWRFEQRGAAPAALLASVVLTLAVVHKRGPFAHMSLADAMASLQSFNAVVATTALFFSSAVAERGRALARLGEIARVAQQAIVHRPAPLIGPIALAARYESATPGAEVGGDLFEAADTPFGVRLFLGDVRGKGLAAVRTAAATLGAFRLLVRQASDLATLVQQVGEHATPGLDDEEFITALFVEITTSQRLRVANLGHLPPLHITAQGVRPLEPTARARPLGLSPGVVVVDEFPFGSDDKVLLFTDGLSEGRDRSGAFFPLAESAAALLGGVTLDLALDELMARFHHHVQDGLTDDVAVVLIAWASELQLSEIAPGVNDSVADPRDGLEDRGISQFPP